ncbi:MAG: hypothetical protein QF464_10185, partial [Myxococcota bacterium]|nr:hypothetical protein [Myxococcota bacterium]
MRLTRLDLPSILSLALCVGAATPALAEGFGGRAVVADFARLAGYGTGPILAAGPALDVAAGIANAHALGRVGCDTRGMTYRELIHPRFTLEIDSPGARRLDLIIQTNHETREISVALDGEPLGLSPLTGEW